MADYVDKLSDAELRTKLAEYGFPVVPITTTTRKVMTKKLKMLIENKNKINAEGRRSLAKYSSEEESDDDSKIKKKDPRRVTLGAGMLPPVPKITRKNKKPDVPEIVERVIQPVPSSPGVGATKSITTETKTRRVTRIIKPVVEEDFEIGSDSEPEIIDEYIDHEHEPKSEPVIKSSYNSPTFSYLSRQTFQPSVPQDTKPYISSRYSSLNDASASGSAASPSTTTTTADNSFERLNQIRSRLSLGSHDKYSDLGVGRTYAGNGGEDVPTGQTPFLSNFSKRLSQLSSTLPKTDFNYKNDVIKDHDANNGSSFATKNYLSRIRNREYPSDFKASQEKNIFKNNIVSFTLLGVAILFFLFLGMMYVGIRSDQPAISDKIDYIMPICEQIKSPKPGLNCVLHNDQKDTMNLRRVLFPELSKRAIAEKCTNPQIKSSMNEDDIIQFIINNYALQDPHIIRTSLRNLQFLIIKNPKWSVSIINTEAEEKTSTALETIEEIANSNTRKNLALVMLDPDLPWKCIIYNKLYTIVISLITIAFGFSAMYAGQKGYTYYLHQRKIKNDKIYNLVEKIIDILQSNATDNADNFLAVNHVRDMLIPPQERRTMSQIWDGAVKFLQENESRVRTEIQIVSGEEFHVWRWLGTNLNSTSSPRSKTWQGQAFETQSGAVNSLPCSPTPCLKIRGMFDERERNFYTVREAVLNKCASKCKILHCEVDLTSGCVYLRCLNQAEAAIAYLNLHGWWYDGHLVTVKYLRLNRYMQRFPDCPSKGPPFLNPASVSPNENNEWTTNDD